MYDNTTSSSSSPRKVAFSQYSQLAFVPKDEAQSKWYSPQEKRKVREAVIQDTRRMMKEMNTTPHQDITAEQLCNCIGIEVFITQDLAMHVEKEKRNHIQAVLAEQSIQRQQGVYAPEKLSDASKNTSRWSRNRARKLAVGYSKMVQK